MYNTLAVTDNITLEKILNIIDEYHIYSYYIGKPVKVNGPISSPFRKDLNPSWSLFRSKQNDIMYKDFATGDTGNVVKFVRTMFSLSYHKALEKIWNDLILPGKIKQRKPRIETEPKTPSKIIGIKRKNFTKTDDDFWNPYGIDREVLKKFNVYPIDCFWVNNIQQPFKYEKDSPMYAYKVFDKFKIYRPFSKKREDKWRNNCGPYDVQGYEQLPKTGELLIITKSLKDVMTLYTLGYSAISPQSENSSIPRKVIEDLKDRFVHLVVLYDNDEGGIIGARKLLDKYNIPITFISKHYNDLYRIKDISDHHREFGKNKTIELIEQVLDEEKESYKQESS